MAMNFAQNAFAYDGHGLAMLYAAPVSLGDVLLAKNLAVFTASGLVCVLLCLFYSVYLHAVPPWVLLAVVAGAATQLPLLVAAGNFLSSLSPRKYHASLRRRDRAPIFTTAMGFVAAVAAVAPTALVARYFGRQQPGPAAALALVGTALAAAAVWRATLPRAAALLERRREAVLNAVTRE